jgi:hypothetical protein
LHGVEDLIHGEIEKGRIGGFAALVGGNGIRAAQDNFFRGIRAVASGVGGSEEGNSGSAKRDGEMKRACVSTDDADCVAQKSHELAEFSIVDEGLRIAAGGFDSGGEGIFAGTVVYDTANSKGGVDFLAELTETIGGPTLGAPSTAGTEDDVTRAAILDQLFAD